MTKQKDKILTETAVPDLVSRVRIGPHSAYHICSLELKEADVQNFVGPRINASDTELIREIERI